MEGGALDPGGEDVRIAEGERGGADFGGRDGRAFEEPVFVEENEKKMSCMLMELKLKM